MTTHSSDKIDWISQGLAVAALLGVLYLHLLPALLAGLLVYHMVEFGARSLSRVGVIAFDGKIILVTVLSVVIVTAFVFATMEFVSISPADPTALSPFFREWPTLSIRAEAIYRSGRRLTCPPI
jgi:hypothetical protein